MNAKGDFRTLMNISNQYPNAINLITKCVRERRYSALLGPRYSGKTDILNTVLGMNKNENTHLSIKINLFDLNGSTTSLLFSQLIRLIGEFLPRQTKVNLNFEYAREFTSADFRAFIQNVLAQSKANIVLVLDHLEALPRDIAHALLTALRAQFMEQQSQSYQLIVIVSGASSLAIQTTGETSPFHNIVTRVILKELSRDESETLLRYQLDKSNSDMSPAARELFIDSTTGDAFLVQELLDRCVRHSNNTQSPTNINVVTVRNIIDDFLLNEAPHYPPFQDAIRLVEDDPYLLQSLVMLLEHGPILRTDLPQTLLPDIDPLDLTSLVLRTEDNRYAIRNEIYKRFLSEKFDPGNVGNLFLAHGRWDLAIHYLGKCIKQGDHRFRSSLLETIINAMYAAKDVGQAAYYLLNGLDIAFGIAQAKVWIKMYESETLEQIEEMGFDKQFLAQVIPITQDSIEGRAFREQLTLRDKNHEHATKLVFPLVSAGKQTIGLLSLHNYSPANRDVDIDLYGYLNRAARALSEVRFRQRQNLQIQSQDVQLQTKANTLYLLYRASTLIQSLSDTKKILHLVLTAITAHFGLRYNRAWLFVATESGNVLEGLSAVGEMSEEKTFNAWQRFSNRTFDEYIASLANIDTFEPSEIDKLTSNMKISIYPLMKDAFSFAFENQRAIKWSHSSNLYGELPSEFQRAFNCEEALLIPLLIENTCFGLLIVDNRFNKRPIDSDDEEILSTFANLCAMAVVQDRKRQSDERRLEIAETLKDVAFVLGNSLELERVLDSILIQIKRVIPFDTASIQWLNDKQTHLQIIRAHGFEDNRAVEQITFPVEGNFPNIEVFKKKEIKHYDDIQKVYKHFSDPRFGVQLIHGWLGVPMILEGMSKGVITLDSYAPRFYSRVDEAMALTFASQAALAIKHAKSFQQQLSQTEYLDNLIRSSLDGIIAVDNHGVVVEYNERAERLCGYNREEVVGKNMRVEKLYAGRRHPRDIQSLLIKNRHIKDFESTILSKSGQRIPILLSASLLTDQDGNPTGSVGFFRDRRQDILVKSVSEETVKLKTGHINKVLDHIAKRVCEFIGSDSVIIYSYVESQQIYDVRHIGSHGISRKSKHFAVKTRSRRSIDELQIQEKANPILIVDDVTTGFDRTHKIALTTTSESFINQEQIKSFLRISLHINNEKVGTLFVNFRGTHIWTENEIKAIQIFAAQAAITINQARLFTLSRKEHKAIDAINRIASKINNVDIDNLWEFILQGGRHITQAQKGRLLIWKESENRFSSEAEFGFEDKENECFQEHEGAQCSFLQKIVNQRESLLIIDSSIDPFPICCEKCSHIQSLLATPIIDPKGKTKAILLLASTKVFAFDTNDQKIINGLTSYAGVAMNNAINYLEVQENLQLLSGLLAAFSDVTAQKDLSTVLQAISDGALKALKCDVVTMYRYDQEKNMIVFPPTVSGQLINRPALNALGEVSRESVVWRLLYSGASLFENDAPNNSNLSTTRVDRKEGYKSFVEREQIRSCAAIVLKIHDRRVGVLFANYRSPHQFNAAEENALLLFANEAAVAINDTDLYGQLSKKTLHLRAVYNASKKVTAGIDRQEILDRILEQVVENVTGVEGKKAIAGSLQIYDEEKNELVFESVYPRDQYALVIEKIGKRLPIKRTKGQKFGITARAAYLRKPQNVPKVEEDSDYKSFSEKTKSELAIPLLDEERLLGVLDVESDIENAFDEQDVAAIRALAELAIIALKKVDQSQEFARTNLVASMGALGAELVHHVKSTVGDIRLKAFRINKYLGVLPADEIRTMVNEIDLYAANLNLPPLPKNPLSSAIAGLEDTALLDNVLKSELLEFQKDHPQIRVSYKLACNGASVAIHKFWLQRVLRHIWRNSAKAMEAASPPIIYVRSRVTKGLARVEIEDNGNGIPPALENILFERPSESGPDHSGHGLIIVRFLIEQYGGRVGFGQRQNGEGAHIFFTLPIVGD